jgi:hypothetical protein
MHLSVPYSEKINKILTFNTQRQIKGKKIEKVLREMRDLVTVPYSSDTIRDY